MKWLLSWLPVVVPVLHVGLTVLLLAVVAAVFVQVGKEGLPEAEVMPVFMTLALLALGVTVTR